MIDDEQPNDSEDTDTDAEAAAEPAADDQEEEGDEAPAVAPETLAGGRLALRLPSNIAERWDLYLASLRVPAISYMRVYAAAIALCWPALRKGLAKHNVHYAGDVVVYGGQVQAILFGGQKPAREPVSLDGFRMAGKAAIELVTRALVTPEAVKANRDF